MKTNRYPFIFRLPKKDWREKWRDILLYGKAAADRMSRTKDAWIVLIACPNYVMESNSFCCGEGTNIEIGPEPALRPDVDYIHEAPHIFHSEGEAFKFIQAWWAKQ